MAYGCAESGKVAVGDYPRGSEWRMWDLHVHTPDSIIQDYAGQAAERWPRFIDELEALPRDIRVLGINDYWFLDGYRKVFAARESGRVRNIEQIFPVIEVRCDVFSGAYGALKRLNLHLILDPTQPIDEMERQLGSVLQAHYRLTPDDDPVEWNEVPTELSMARLGEKIRESTPPDKKAEFEGMSDLEIGFNNLNVSFDEVRKAIDKNTYLRKHVLLAVGKAEWNNIKWSVSSIANKKTYINSVQAVFTAAKSRDAFASSLASLKSAQVLHRLLDCSDAHTWSDSTEHTRLGACFTWINADPTFKGLRQALQEYDQRITVNERPMVLTRIAQSPRSVITAVALRSAAPSLETPIFATSTPLNPGFVAVIGNKGQGKSALLDSIALAANSDRQEDFSFLNTRRFRSSATLASQYEVELQWADSSVSTAKLGDEYSPAAPIRVDYLPQSLIEKVCSADPNSVTKREFEFELERVVFRHIDDEARGDATSLKQFLDREGSVHRVAAKEARANIAEAAHTLSAQRRRRAELEALDLIGRESSLTERLREVQNDLESVTAQIDSGGGDDQQERATALRTTQSQRQSITEELDRLQGQIDVIANEVAQVEELREGVLEAIADARSLVDELASSVGVAPESLLEISFEAGVIDTWIGARASERTALEESRTRSGGLNDQLAVATLAVEDKQEALQSLNEEVQALLVQKADLEAQAADLLGEPGEAESIRGIEALKAELGGASPAISSAEISLKEAFRTLHAALLSIKELQHSAYEPATQFVESNELAKSVELGFDVELRVRDFADRWLGMVNRQKLGQFYDMNRPDLDEQMLGGVDLDNPDNLLSALDQIVDRLSRESGRAEGLPRSLEVIMRSGYTPADLLSAIYGLEWLHSQYIIRSGGLELSELSPGQRGLVLLLFYLLVDKSERPLLLDQPEENLDNQTVRNVLVPALREAVSRRQVIAVTHNPNFAVVGDADQIIVASYVDGKFGYASGSLAELQIGESAINVLEGTRQAFTSRSIKYTDVVGRGS